MDNETYLEVAVASNETNMTTSLEPLDCPQFSNETADAIETFAYWVEGVLLCVIAVPGIAGNALSSYILSGKTMRNSFNILLIALALFDNTYLIGSILESFRKRFQLYTDLHIILFPYFLYPLLMMAMTGSILMTVAIGLERYVAVHHPINYSRATNDAHALKRRLCKYLVPVTVISILFNVTKFFEITYVYIPIQRGNRSTELQAVSSNNLTSGNVTELFDTDISGDVSVPINETVVTAPDLSNITEYRVILNITEFRMDPNYSIYFNWTRFVILGVIPFILLIFFNAQIYWDIRKRRKRKMARAGGGGGGPKSVADPPSKATIVNSETAVRIQTKSFRPKLKLTFKDQTNSINNKVSKKMNTDENGKLPSFPPKGSRVAVLAVEVDDNEAAEENDVRTTDLSKSQVRQEVRSIDDVTASTSRVVTAAAQREPGIDSKSNHIEHHHHHHHQQQQQHQQQSEVENGSKMCTVLGEVRFCNGRNSSLDSDIVAGGQLKSDILNDRGASPSHIEDEDEDDLDHVTTISVDVHTMDSLRGPVKVSPVSSAGLDCSCGESCACSSYDSEDDRPNDEQDFSTNSIACQTEQPPTSVVVVSNAVDKKSSTKTLSPNACRASKKLRNHSGQSIGTHGNHVREERKDSNEEACENVPLLSENNQVAANQVGSSSIPKSVSATNCNHILAATGNNSPSLSVATTVVSRPSEANLTIPKRNCNNNNNVSNNNNNNGGGSNNRTESNLAAIMMGYVLVFLICHLPRLLLNIHELATIRNAMACGRAGQKPFHAWSIIVMHISHLLLVVNSSINILIYCCLSSKFREEGSLVLKRLWKLMTKCAPDRQSYGRDRRGIELTSLKTTTTSLLPKQTINRFNH